MADVTLETYIRLHDQFSGPMSAIAASAISAAAPMAATAASASMAAASLTLFGGSASFAIGSLAAVGSTAAIAAIPLAAVGSSAMVATNFLFALGNSANLAIVPLVETSKAAVITSISLSAVAHSSSLAGSSLSVVTRGLASWGSAVGAVTGMATATTATAGALRALPPAAAPASSSISRISALLGRLRGVLIYAAGGVGQLISSVLRIPRSVKSPVDVNSFNSSGSAVNRLKTQILGLVGAYVSLQGVSKVLGLADRMASSRARLSMVNDGRQSNAELQQKVYAAAQRSNADFLNLSDFTANVGMMAGGAFSSNDQLVRFAELIQKQFAVSGTSGAQASAATLQLSQALASGRLQGDEFRSISENAPSILLAVEKYAGIGRKQLREMAREGSISADIITNAIFASAAETEARYAKMPMTFAQAGSRLKTSALESYQFVLEKISAITQNEKFTAFFRALEDRIYGLAIVTGNVIDSLAAGANWVYDNWDAIRPVLSSVATGLGIVLAGYLAFSAAPAIVAAIANPWLWVAAGISAAVYAMETLNASHNDMYGTSYTVLGDIGGLWDWLNAHVYNGFSKTHNFAVNTFAAIRKSFAYAQIGMLESFRGFYEDVIKKLRGIAEFSDRIFKTNFAAAAPKNVDDEIERLKKTAEEVEENRRTALWEEENASDAFHFGPTRKMFENFQKSLTGASKPQNPFAAAPAVGNIPVFSQIAANTKKTAKNTEKNDYLIKYFREFAEKQTVNRFTSANLKIDFTANNNIADGRNMDGIIEGFADKLREELYNTAKGVNEY